MVCKWIRFLYRVLPLAAWRAFLLDRHIDRCPRCQAEALGADTIRSLAIAPTELEGEPPLRPFGGEINPFRPAQSFWVRRWAFGFLLVAVFWGGVFVVWRAAPRRSLPKGIVAVVEAEGDAYKFAVIEARIGGEPARPVIFKPRQPGMTIVWFEKSIN